VQSFSAVVLDVLEFADGPDAYLLDLQAVLPQVGDLLLKLGNLGVAFEECLLNVLKCVLF